MLLDGKPLFHGYHVYRVKWDGTHPLPEIPAASGQVTQPNATMKFLNTFACIYTSNTVEKIQR